MVSLLGQKRRTNPSFLTKDEAERDKTRTERIVRSLADGIHYDMILPNSNTRFPIVLPLQGKQELKKTVETNKNKTKSVRNRDPKLIVVPVIRLFILKTLKKSFVMKAVLLLG